MTTAIVPGSIASVAEQQHQSVAETFLSADVIVVVDVSGSMDSPDSRGGRKRYDVACDELATLQKTLPGKVAVVSFSSNVQFCPGGVPYFEGAGTDLAGALRFVKVADGTVRFIVISDGQPNDEQGALDVARTFTSVIDTVFVGPEEDRISARFLEDLARASRGRFATADTAQDLNQTVQTLLLAAGS